MKKKIFYTLSMVFILFFSVILTACGTIGGPDAGAAVIGNGGLVVQKGDWLFFANGFESSGSLESGHKNQNGKVEISALYRVPLNENNLLDVDSNLIPTKAEKIVSKVVGFENGGIYVFDEWIYFASPTTHRDIDGKYHFDQLTFFKCRFDGSSLSEIYTTVSYSSTGKYMFDKISGKVYLVVLDGTDLIKVEIGKSSVKLAENVTGAMMIAQKDYTGAATDVPALKGKVFYTRERTEEEGSTVGIYGNYLIKADIVSGNKETLCYNNSEKIELKAITFSRVFYSILNSSGKGYIYSSALPWSNPGKKHTNLYDVTSIYVFEDSKQGTNDGFVYTLNSRTYYQEFNNLISNEILSFAPSNIIKCTNKLVYYIDESSNICSIDAGNKNIINLSNNTAAIKTDTSKMITILGNYIYFFHQENGSSNYYLFRIFLDGSSEIEHIGIPIASDLIEIEDEEE